MAADPPTGSTTTSSTTTTTSVTTVTTTRVIEKVGVVRRSPWWPLAVLPLLPAIVAAVSFGDPAPAPTTAAAVPTAATAKPVAGAADTSVTDSGAASGTDVGVTAPAVTAGTVTAADETAASVTAGDVTAPAASDTTTPAATSTPATTSSPAPTSTPAPTAAPTTIPAASRPANVVMAAGVDGRLGSFNAAVEAAGIKSTLTGDGPLTVFAPSDAAFAALPEGALATLLKPENKAALVEVLRYHVVPKSLEGAALRSGTYATLDGTTVKVASSGGTVTVTDPAGTVGTVALPGLPAQNGVVYVVDHVVLPPGFTFPGEKNAAGDAVAEDLTVYFDTGSSVLNRAATTKVARAAEILAALPPGTKVSLVGHADKRGNPARNQVLSEERVDAVLAALKAKLGDRASGITFSAEHRGDTEPAENLAKSRRVTIEIQK